MNAPGSGWNDLGIRHDGTESLRYIEGLCPVRFNDDCGKLLSAGAAKDVHAAQSFIHQARDDLQNKIASPVPPCVVDRFEVVDIDHQQRERTVETDCASQFALRQINEVAAIEEPGQVVCLGLKLRLFLELLLKL